MLKEFEALAQVHLLDSVSILLILQLLDIFPGNECKG